MDTMWLQSNDRFREGCVLNSDESVGPIMLKTELHVASPPCGSFGRVEGEIAFFYRWQGVLTFRFGQTQPIRLCGAITKWSNKGKRGCFIIQNEQGVVFDKEFVLSSDVLNIGNDMTAFADAEDFDFLLFIHNVQSSAERRELIYRK
jgi:hypothetical protein